MFGDTRIDQSQLQSTDRTENFHLAVLYTVVDAFPIWASADVMSQRG